jgi:hypothetical protein
MDLVFLEDKRRLHGFTIFFYARIMNKLNKILDLKWEICAIYIAEMVGCIVTKVVERLVLPKSLFSVSI